MIHSREIALRCAAAMPRHVFPRAWANERRLAYIERFDVWPTKPYRELPKSLLDQLDACKDDEARRLILGKSR